MLSKLKLTILLSAFILACTPLAVMAQQADVATMKDENPVITDVEGLRLQIAQHTQDPYTKEVRLDVVVYSQITSDRVQITWTVNGVSKLLTSTTYNLSVTPGQYYIRSATILPQGLGTTQVIAKVQAFKADGAYISTASKVLGSLTSQELVPQTTQFRIAQLALAIRGFAAFILVSIILGILAVFAFMQFKKWFDRDN